MTAINTYLNFKGNCDEAFKAYEKILGGKILVIHKAEDPKMGGPDFVGKVMHARMKVGDALLMGSDSLVNHERTPQGFSVNVSVQTPAEADRIYAALAEGGKETMPIAETFWALRFGMCVDRFGTPWMVNCEKANLGRP
jgi:PhnB protein